MTTAANVSSSDASVTATSSTTRVRFEWLPVIGGLVGGIVAAGAAGTSTETIFLGAVWAGTAAGVLIILAASYLAVRNLRGAMPAAVFRRQLRVTVRRAVNWALGAYVFWFLIIEPALSHANIKVPMFG